MGSSCSESAEPLVAEIADSSYSFFVAGHAYGRPGDKSGGVFEPFKARFYEIIADSGIAFGVFVGDMIIESRDTFWDLLEKDLEELRVPLHFVPGNHDAWDPEFFERRVGKHYYSFKQGQDLFVILNSNPGGYGIRGERLRWFRETLKENDDARNVFLFHHHMLWWKEDNQFAPVIPNGQLLELRKTNFWTDIKPMLDSLQKPVYMFSGDVGAHADGPDHMYYNDRDLHYIATGMGSKKVGNYVRVKVGGNGEVELKLVPLKSGTAASDLKEFKLPATANNP